MTEQFTVSVDGVQLVGEWAGSGQPVLFLHAGVADSRMWQPQVADLSDHYQTIVYDRRGFGRTTAVDEPFSHLEDLRAVLDYLELETVSLVGCSQGARVAIDFALAYPQRVTALVLIAAAVTGAPAPGDLPAPITAILDALDEAEEANDMTRVNELEAHLWLDGPTGSAGRVTGPLRALFLDMNGIALRMPEFTQEIEATAAYGRLSELTLPVLVLWGELDFPHVKERAHYLLNTMPGAIGEEIPNTAHLPNLERPEQVNRLLRDFLG